MRPGRGNDEKQNIEKKWASPADPARARNQQPGWEAYLKNDPSGVDLDKKPTRKSLKSKTHLLVEKGVKCGAIKDRDTMIMILEHAGYSITRKGKDYITVKKADVKDRLKGTFYNEKWKSIKNDIEESNPLELEKENFYSEKNYIEIKSEFEQKIKKTKRYNQKQYKKVLTNNNNLGKFFDHLNSSSGIDKGGPVVVGPPKPCVVIPSDAVQRARLMNRGREVLAGATAKARAVVDGIRGLDLPFNIKSKVVGLHMSEELERFKMNINLVEFACSYGFSVVQNKTSENSVFLCKDDDRIIIKKDEDGHFVYCDIDNAGGGSIIDFCIEYNPSVRHIGHARKELRGNHPRPDFRFTTMNGKKVKAPKKSEIDQNSIDDFFRKTKQIERNRYLESRFLDPDIYLSPRFKNRILTDSYNNAIFPSSKTTNSDFDSAEIRNESNGKKFVGQIKSSKKGIWRSNISKADKTLVFAESAIDCLSYAQMHPSEDTGYISFGGGLSDAQKEEIARILNVFPGEIVVATDNDKDGEKYYDFFRSIRPDVVRDRPKLNDWNDELKAQNLQRIEQSNGQEIR